MSAHTVPPPGVTVMWASLPDVASSHEPTAATFVGDASALAVRLQPAKEVAATARTAATRRGRQRMCSLYPSLIRSVPTCDFSRSCRLGYLGHLARRRIIL